MTVRAGSRLGPYEIIAAIGAGGMGEVFRARDTKLNREVAIKVLPAAFAQDHERVARFKREAQVLASLNHPNIATIYGIEEIASSPSSAGLVAMTKGGGSPAAADASAAPSTVVATVALVMEMVEGEDLSDHLARGPILLAEALPIARQIAEALEARTIRASSTATSSRTTSRSAPTARSRSSTSVSPRRWIRPRIQMLVTRPL